MLSVYLIACGFGGTLLLASMLFGGDGDGSADAGAEADAGADGGDADGADGGDGDGGDLGDAAWAAARSLRFWTFVLGFGGAVGALLTYLGSGPTLLIAAVALGTGLAAGTIATAIVRATAGGASSTLSARDLVGRVGTVTIAIVPGVVGKVRITSGGQIVDVLAESDDVLAIGAEVMIVGEGADGRVVVTRAVA